MALEIPREEQVHCYPSQIRTHHQQNKSSYTLVCFFAGWGGGGGGGGGAQPKRGRGAVKKVEEKVAARNSLWTFAVISLEEAGSEFGANPRVTHFTSNTA